MQSNPNALSCKWPHVVTRPDVDHELWLWVQQMETKGGVVSGPMLMAKQEAFEALEVPADKRLPGSGWLQPFYQVWVIYELVKLQLTFE